MSRINDAVHFNSGQTVTRKGTRVFVSQNNHLDTKTGVTTFLNDCLIYLLFFSNLMFPRPHMKHGAKGCSFLGKEIRIGINEYPAGLVAKLLISKAFEKSGR